MLEPTPPSCDALSPSGLANSLRRAELPHVVDFVEQRAVSSLMDELAVTAQAAERQGNLLQVIDSYQDMQELGHDVEEVLTEKLSSLYPMADGSRIGINHTDSFRRKMNKCVKSGEAERLSTSPPIYLLHNLLSEAEVASIRSMATRRQAQWAKHHPLVCFQHDAYTAHPGLSHAWDWRVGKPGAGARGCFTQAASRAVSDSLPWSDSLFVYRGQEPALDSLSTVKLPEMTGLHDAHSKSWQVLSYEAGRDGGYAEHTDCEAADELLTPATRMATLIVYLSDDFEGGETEFPLLGLKL